MLKFGGTSVGTREQREVAFARVRDARETGYATVAVVSAMGRPPDPYATDTLLALIEGRRGSANADLLLSAGELISAAIFADELAAAGVPARHSPARKPGSSPTCAMATRRFCGSTPRRSTRCSNTASFPWSPAFKGVAEDGAVTTLGRGGTDLSAIAIGHALEAQRVDIYTDVSGAMTADPRRTPTRGRSSARRLPR